VPLAVSNGEVILIVVLVTIPIAAITFALGAGRALGQIGKGRFAVEFEHDLDPSPVGEEPGEAAGDREAEIRQLLEAKAYRQRARGEAQLDIDSELERLLSETEGEGHTGSDRELVEEVRQLAIARNERRLRQGKAPLDIEAEVERHLRELENLGQ
jgi:hypothetical protein